MNFDRLAELFDRASQLATTAEVDAFLANSCEEDPEMRRQIEALLAVREPAAGFLEAVVQISPPAASADYVDDRIDRYRLLQKLGEGGCGIVYLAEQREPVQRRVALKIIKPGMDSRSVIARFEAERQALARMDHPNVAKVFDAGITASGRPYFVMELVEGVRITEYCDAARLPLAARLELFIKVCHAIQHAHQKGVIHRDIKPANILVAVQDGIPEPKVIDFGIAKAIEGRLTDHTVVTAYELFLGTPAYMSPEQAAASPVDIDTRSDIYSLGVLLYELLAGCPPFETRELMALGLDEMLRTIREKDPVRPSTRLRRTTTTVLPTPVAPRVHLGPLPSDLDWIIMRCLEKDRSRRYETANGLAMDLRRHLVNEPVLARPPTGFYRLRKAYRRNRASFLAATLVSVAMVVGILISTWQAAVARRESRRASLAESATAREARQATSERDRALAAQAEANRHAEQARRLAYVANLNVVGHAWLDGNLARVNDLLLAQVPGPGEEDLRDFEWRYYWEQSRSQAIRHRQVGRTPARRVHFTADGSRLFTAHLDDVARVLDPVSLEPQASLTLHPIDLALSRDGRSLAILSDDGFVELFDAESLRLRRRIGGLAATADQLSLSPDGTRLAISEDRWIRIWDAETGENLDAIPIRPRPIAIGSFAASADWSHFLTSDEHSVYLWDRVDHALVAELAGHPGGTYCASFSADGQWLATGGWRNNTIRLWDVASKELRGVFTNHTGWIGSLDFSTDTTTLVSGSADHTLRLWDLRLKQPKGVLRGAEDEVWMATFSRDGRSLVSADRGGGISVWNAEPEPDRPAELQGEFIAGEFAADGRSFVTVTGPGLVQTWDVETLRSLGRESIPLEGSALLRIGPGARCLAEGLTNGVIRLHDPMEPRSIRTLTHPGGRPFLDLSFSRNQSRLASVTAEDFRLWDLTSGGCLYHRSNFADAYWKLTPVALSPEGTRVAFGGTNLLLRIVDLANGAERVLDPDLWGMLQLGFSPDGSLLAAAGRDHQIRIWRCSDYQEVTTLKAWRQSAHGFEFHPRGRRLVVGSGEGGIRWFDLATAQEVAHFPTSLSPRHLVFSPDGNILAVRSGVGFRFWHAPGLEQIHATPSPHP